MEYQGRVIIQLTNSAEMAIKAGKRMTLHCQQCNTLLGDSFGVCGEIKSLDSIVCLKVTSAVVVSDDVEAAYKGELTDCVFSCLKCRGCRCAVGIVIHSAPVHLAAVRSLFLLYKANIGCYIIGCSSVVKASTLRFDLKPLRLTMSKAREYYEEQLDEMTRVKNKVDKRKEKRSELVK